MIRSSIIVVRNVPNKLSANNQLHLLGDVAGKKGAQEYHLILNQKQVLGLNIMYLNPFIGGKCFDVIN